MHTFKLCGYISRMYSYCDIHESDGRVASFFRLQMGRTNYLGDTSKWQGSWSLKPTGRSKIMEPGLSSGTLFFGLAISPLSSCLYS
jgi:hypothetical protein